MVGGEFTAVKAGRPFAFNSKTYPLFPDPLGPPLSARDGAIRAL